MKQSDNRRRSPCPISCGLDVLGDKWTLLIIRDLMFRDKRSYGEFHAAGEHIATNILADRLKKLESENFVKKSVDPNNKSKYRYRLTEKGVDLLPMLLEFIAWSTKHIPGTATPKEFIDQLENDRESLIASIRNTLLGMSE
jgi:DNA-binding HxlR family transcriptional regulator